MSAQMELARLRFEQGEWALAMEAAQSVLVQDPDCSEAIAMLGLCLHNQSRPDDAWQVIGDGLSFRAESIALHAVRVQLALARGRLAEAKHSLEVLHHGSDEDSFVAGMQAEYEGEMGNPDGQEEWLKEALRRAPEDFFAMSRYAEFLAHRGDHQKAKELAQKTLEEWPEKSDAHHLAARIALTDGGSQAAKERFREALRRDPHNEEARQGYLEAMRSHNPFYGWVHRIRPRLLRSFRDPLTEVIVIFTLAVTMMIKPVVLTWALAALLLLGALVGCAWLLSELLLFAQKEGRMAMTPSHRRCFWGLFALAGSLATIPLLGFGLDADWTSWLVDASIPAVVIASLFLGAVTPLGLYFFLILRLFGLATLFWYLPFGLFSTGLAVGAGLWSFLPTSLLWLLAAWATWSVKREPRH